MQIKNKYIFLISISFIAMIFTSCSKKGMSVSGSKRIETIAQLPVQSRISVPNKVIESTNGPIAITKSPVSTHNNKLQIESAVYLNNKNLPLKQKNSLDKQSYTHTNNSNIIAWGHKLSSPVRLTHDTKEVMGITNQCCMFIVILAALVACLAVLVKVIKLSWFPITTFNTYLLVAVILILLLIAIVKLFELLV